MGALSTAELDALVEQAPVDNVSGYVAEAVARQIRHQLLGADLRRHQEEHGAFTEEELSEARTRIFDAVESSGPASAA